MNGEPTRDGGPPGEATDPKEMLAFCHQVTERYGQRAVARMLNVSRSVLQRCIQTETLTPALEEGLRNLRGTSSEGTVQRPLQLREDAGGEEDGELPPDGGWEQDLQEALARIERLEQIVVALQGELADLRAQQADFTTVSGGAREPSTPVTPAPTTRRRVIGEMLSARNDEEYGEAAPLVREWRAAREERSQARTKLVEAMAEERMRVAELTLIEEHGLTLPPERQPWNEYDRQEQLVWRRRALIRTRKERVKAEWWRGLRRAISLGQWKN